MANIKLTEEQLKLLEGYLVEAGRKNQETDEESVFLTSTKSATIRLARERIGEMSSSPILSNMISIFIVLLTDPDSIPTLKSIGTQYGKQVKKYTDDNGLDFEEKMVQGMKSKIKRLMLSMLEEIKMSQNEDDPINDPEGKQQELEQDKNNLQQIRKKFGI